MGMWYGLVAVLVWVTGARGEASAAQASQLASNFHNRHAVAPWVQPSPNHRANLLRLKQTSGQTTCPTEIEPLTALLVRDLPSYANRQSRSAIPLDRTLNRSSVVIIAGRPEFEPLPLAPGQPAPNRGSDPAQVFISTLERQYLNDRSLETQQYHWLFLTRSTNGWRLAIMFTRTGSAIPGMPSTPPRDSSDGAIAQAIKTWLRDCRAGLIRG